MSRNYFHAERIFLTTISCGPLCLTSSKWIDRKRRVIVNFSRRTYEDKLNGAANFALIVDGELMSDKKLLAVFCGELTLEIVFKR